MSLQHRCLAFFLTLLLAAAAAATAQAAEQTVTTATGSYRTDDVNWTGKYEFSEDSELEKEIGLPVYRWSPVGQEPRAIVLGVHGLTLHATCYEVLARGFAAGGYLFIAPDMRGYGKNSLPTAPESVRKIDNEASYHDLERLAATLNKRYPDLTIGVLGESLGTCFCVRLAAEHQDLIDAIIIAAPTAKVNPLMYASPRAIGEGLRALFTRNHLMHYSVFFQDLVSSNPEIVNELENDPLVVTRLPLGTLIETQAFVAKTIKWAKSIKPNTPVLILQGSKDKAMVPREVVKLAKQIESTDQTIRWLTGYSHLLLETAYIQPPSLDAIADFIDDHDPDRQVVKKDLYGQMLKLGAKELPAQQ